MATTKIVLVGEGSAEPTSGFRLVQEYFKDENVTFYFGVRRSQEGLDQLNAANSRAVANFPGRGMKTLNCPVSICNLSTFAVHQAIASNRLTPDAVLIVATPPDTNGIRSVGTANGPISTALNSAKLVFVEEYPDLQIAKGAPTIRPEQVVKVIPHQPAAFTALSRRPDEADYTIAKHIALLIPNGAAVQMGVGGIIDALSEVLCDKRNLKSISGAIGSAVRRLDEQGNLDPNHNIYGSALVGDDDLINWATDHPKVNLLGSNEIHNPKWISKTPQFHSINVGISVDLAGNINAESVGERKISGKGGSPNFSKGAHFSSNGLSIFALRTDKGTTLVDHISKPTVQGQFVDCLVTEQGSVILKGKTPEERANLIKSIFINQP